MITREVIGDLRWIVHCDKCSFYDEFDGNLRFVDLLKRLREVGWRSMFGHSEWIHACPECAPK